MTMMSWDSSHTLVDEENIMMVCGFGPALPLKTFNMALIRRYYLLSSADQSNILDLALPYIGIIFGPYPSAAGLLFCFFDIYLTPP